MAGRGQVEPLGDLGPRRRSRGSGQRDPRYLGPPFVQRGQLQVVGAEVMAPLGHAVRLVDREQRDRAALQHPQGRLGAEAFRREVEQVKPPAQERRLHLAPLARFLRGVDEPGPHAECPQRVDLVLHQRDQRRDNHTGAGPQQRRDLVAQRLAAAGRHEHQGVAAGR